MKIYLLLLTIISSLIIYSHPQDYNSQTLASVGDHNITLSEFAGRYSNFLISSGTNDNLVVRKAILDNMINEILLYNYDSNKEIYSNLQYQKELERARKHIILAYLKDQEIYAKISVTDEELRETFLRANEKIAARHLFARTEEEANNLYELLKIGVGFESLARQVFTDSVLQNNGGYLGYFTWGDMDPDFEEAAYSLRVGEISTPVKTVFGYSIIKLEDRVSHPLLTEYEFIKKKSHLERVLKIKKKKPSEKEYIGSIFNRTKLSFNDESLQKILTDLSGNSEEIESGNKKSLKLTCAAYDKKVYSLSEIEKKLYDLPFNQRERINSVETLKAAIEGLLIQDILFNMALSKNYDKAEPVLNMYSGVKKNIYLKYKMDEITGKTPLPDSVVFKYYLNNVNSFSTENELNLQEIIVSDKILADSLVKLISEGEDFGKLAKNYSLRQWSAENNGIMGFTPLSRLGSYGEMFWNSKVGEIIGSIKIENLYGVFRVLGKKEGKPIDFDFAKDEVTKAAKFEMQVDIIKDYIDLLRKKNVIKINEDLLGSYNIAG